MNLAFAPRQHLRGIGLAAWALLTAGALTAAPLPGGFAHSGWYQFELIVLADTQSETLESETWPLLPNVGYPARWRWLKDPAMQAKLKAAYPDATVIANPSGHLSVRLPASPAPTWIAPEGLLTEGDLSLIDELIELGEGTDTSAYRLSLETLAPASSEPDLEGDAPGPVLPFEAVAPAEPTPLTALESLGMAGSAPEPSSTAVAIPFAAPVVLPALQPVTVLARSIPMPESFIRQPLQQLAPGLARYRRNSDDELIASASWLQGPQDDTLAILLEPDTDSDYPLVQGFVQLLPRGGAWRLGLNFWANTQGHYLPDFFEMPPPPPSPRRVAVIEAITASLPPASTGALPEELIAESTSSALDTDLTGSAIADMGRQPNTRSDPGVSEATSDAASAPLLNNLTPAPERPEWPWRHMIHVADTIPLTENRLRYYDHPVVKVIALWRELSWYEVFSQGRRTLSESESETTPLSITNADRTDDLTP